MRRLLFFYTAEAGFAMLRGGSRTMARKVVKRGENADELQAERRVGMWILIFLVLIAIIYLGLKLASRDINSGGPTIESRSFDPTLHVSGLPIRS
jgi:hypothetical protein